jgi:hypothetical protein
LHDPRIRRAEVESLRARFAVSGEFISYGGSVAEGRSDPMIDRETLVVFEESTARGGRAPIGTR